MPTKPTESNPKARAIGRRDLLKSALVAGAGLTILRSGVLSGADAPSNKLNIAMIGTWGRADAHFGVMSSENIVALCDVNEDHLNHAVEKFPKAQTYTDWRKCLDQKGIDAVVCCTTDFTHAFIANWAMNRGMHVYCEKPLGNTVEEARTVRLTYLKNKAKLATQCGTQRHEIENFNRVSELVRDGAIGELQAVFAWGNRKLPKPGYPAGEGEPPTSLHYDLWLGPCPNDHPYSPKYFALGPGANCLSWNMFWDFGSGQIGDMGSHTMDLAWCAIDAGLPTSAEATSSEKPNPDVTPVELTMKFEHPANDWRPAITVSWYQGGAMPKDPSRYVPLHNIDHGVMFKGSKGHLVADFDTRCIIPWGGGADLSYYKPRPKDKMFPPLGNFQQEWIKACKGNLKTTCNFDYSGTMTEQMLLGLVAFRVGEKIQYDGATGKVTNNEKANALLGHEYRKGWSLNG
jgi:predicted dehydrogenase